MAKLLCATDFFTRMSFSDGINSKSGESVHVVVAKSLKWTGIRTKKVQNLYCVTYKWISQPNDCVIVKLMTSAKN